MLTQETEDYWIWNEDILVFKPEFNKPLNDYINIIQNYDILIFSNYSDIAICIKTNNQYIYEFKKYFLKSNFNQKVNNLPSSLKKLTFNEDSKYDKELNCLPKKLELLQLPFEYKLEIKNVPNGLNKVICSEDYEYINNFKGLKIETYE